MLSPRNSIDKRIKWALLVHIVTMFTFLTIPIGIDGSERSDCYIDNRNFPGNDEYAPGPLGCGSTLDTTASATVLTVMFPFNQWLADGLLAGLISNSVAEVFNVGCTFSCIVAMPFIS